MGNVVRNRDGVDVAGEDDALVESAVGAGNDGVAAADQFYGCVVDKRA